MSSRWSIMIKWTCFVKSENIENSFNMHCKNRSKVNDNIKLFLRSKFGEYYIWVIVSGSSSPLLTTWEVNSLWGDKVGKDWLGDSILHHQDQTVCTLFHLHFDGSASRSKETIIPRHDWDLRTTLKLFAAFPLVSLGSTPPLDTSCTPWPKMCMPCQHMVLNFPRRWTWQVRHCQHLSEPLRPPCRHRPLHVQTRLAQSPAPPPMEPLCKDSKCWIHHMGPTLFLPTVLRVLQAYSAWCSALSRGSPPTEVRRRPVPRLPRPQDEESIFRMQWNTSLNPCDGFPHRCHMHTSFAVWRIHLPLSITPDTAS